MPSSFYNTALPEMIAIKTNNLSKKFKDLVAVSDVDLEIQKGECFGLLGPNGAGKTSLIRMIIAISPPTKGEIWIFDQNLVLNDRKIKSTMGVVPQNDNLDSDLTVLQNLVTFARYFDMSLKEARKRSVEVLNLFQLLDRRNSRVEELSGGMRRRLLIARGLLNSPNILVLDEPTIGLDPQAKYLVWHKLTELKAEGVTQLISTQNMEEAASLCDRVAIMHQGSILDINSPERLICKYVGEKVWEIEVDLKHQSEVRDKLRTMDFEFEEAGNAIHIFHVKHEGHIREIASKYKGFRRRAGTLEDVFLRLTGRALNE